MKKTYTPAIIIALFTFLWLASGELFQDDVIKAPSLSELNNIDSKKNADIPTNVRGRIIRSSEQTAFLKIRGRTKANRSLELRSEISGKAVSLKKDRGDWVSTNEAVCQIATNDLKASFKEAKELVTRAKIEHSAALELQKKNLQSATQVALTRANLATALTNLTRRRINLNNTIIRSSFAGVIETRPVEVGTLMQPGTICAKIIELDPLLIVAQVAEKDAPNIKLGQTAQATLITGETVTGTLTFISRAANLITSTYEIEITLPNPDKNLRSGITANISLPIGIHKAQFVSAALLGLDDSGKIGIRTVDSDDSKVYFHNVNIVSEEPRGIWVTGLPDITTLITVGQEIVVPGQVVNLTYEDELSPQSISINNTPLP